MVSKKEQEQIDAQTQQTQQDQAAAQAQAQASNVSAPAPAPASTSDTPLQTVGNTELSQAQKDVLAQNRVQQNIQGDQDAHIYNENLTTLKRVVGLASPVIERVEKTQEGKDAAGNTINVPITEDVIVDYTYYSIDGKDIETWINETFQGKITLDKRTATINYNQGVDAGGVPNPSPPQTGGEQQK